MKPSKFIGHSSEFEISKKEIENQSSYNYWEASPLINPLFGDTDIFFRYKINDIEMLDFSQDLRGFRARSKNKGYTFKGYYFRPTIDFIKDKSCLNLLDSILLYIYEGVHPSSSMSKGSLPVAGTTTDIIPNFRDIIWDFVMGLEKDKFEEILAVDWALNIFRWQGNFSKFEEAFFGNLNYGGWENSFHDITTYERKVRDNLRYYENEIRHSHGFKAVGKLVRADLLLREVKKAFKGFKVRSEVSPPFLDGLRYDIFIKDLNIAIEYNGRQHYEFVKYWHKTKKNFKETQARDEKKKRLSKENGIELIEVHYSADFKEIIETLKKTLTSE